MGYTHYFTQKGECTPVRWRRIQEDFMRCVQVCDVPIALEFDEAKPPEISSKRIWFNGRGDDGHETMVLTRDGEGFAFCKTAQKPYDVLVVALLLLAHRFARHAWEISSDGDPEDWLEAQSLVLEACGYTVFLPAGVEVPA